MRRGMHLTSVKGQTLLELAIAVGALGIITASSASLVSNIGIFYRQATVRNQLITDSASCMNTMREFLSLGKASTVVIDSPPSAPPYSRIQFKMAADLTPCTFFWSNNTIQMQAKNHTPTTIAWNVQALSFSFPDTTNPTQLSVSLRMQANISASKQVTVSMPDQVVAMAP